MSVVSRRQVRREGGAGWWLRLALAALLALGVAVAGLGTAVLAGLGEPPPAPAAAKRGTVVAWGCGDDTNNGQCAVPAGLEGVVAVAGSAAHSLALKADGTVVAWGCQGTNINGGSADGGQCAVPAGLTGVTAIAAGHVHSLALRADGTVVAWGCGGQATGACAVPAGLTGVTAISAGGSHSLALKADGTVVTWGCEGLNTRRCEIPSWLGDVVAIAASEVFSLALIGTTGNVVVWGDYLDNNHDVPAGLGGGVAVAAGFGHSLALRWNGTVVAWGLGIAHQTDVPAGLSGVTAVAASRYNSLALKEDGTVVAWGCDGFGQCDVPAGLTGVTAIASGDFHGLAVVGLHKLAVRVAGGGTVARTPAGERVVDPPAHPAGTVVTLTATPDAGQMFAAWTVDGVPVGSTNPLAITMDAPHDVWAIFTAVPAPPIDRTPPTIALGGLKPVYTLGEAVNPSCTATDDLSGVDPRGCRLAVSGGLANGVGSFTVTATATDNAGNTATATGSYRVVYRFDGFLEPIDDPANPECGAGCTPSVFKAGGTVTAKFDLKRADGTIVEANSLPVWLTPVQGGPTTAPVDEESYNDSASSGGTYEPHAQQYRYKWSTKGTAAGYYYRLGVTLDDGQTYYVTIALR